MDNSENSSIGCLALIVYIVSWLGSGILAWNWVSPASFFGALIFLIVWSLLGYVAQLIGFAIIVGLER